MTRTNATATSRALVSWRVLRRARGPMVLEPGYAKKIPAGSRLTFQMHYTPIGSPQKDRSGVALVFTEQRRSHALAVDQQRGQPRFRHSAGRDRLPGRGEKTFPRDTLLMSLFPHMHVRGKSFRYEVTLPGRQARSAARHAVVRLQLADQLHSGRAEVAARGDGDGLHGVVRQLGGEPAQPRPQQEVRWGDQTWEEMMIGWYDIAFPIDQFEQLVKDSQKPLKKLLKRNLVPPAFPCARRRRDTNGRKRHSGSAIVPLRVHAGCDSLAVRRRLASRRLRPQSGRVVADAKYTSPYDAFMKMNRFREKFLPDESASEYWGFMESRLGNQAGRILIKRPAQGLQRRRLSRLAEVHPRLRRRQRHRQLHGLPHACPTLPTANRTRSARPTGPVTTPSLREPGQAQVVLPRRQRRNVGRGHRPARRKTGKSPSRTSGRISKWRSVRSP